jgi:GNAT superfamily N-acetyltransferase
MLLMHAMFSPDRASENARRRAGPGSRIEVDQVCARQGRAAQSPMLLCSNASLFKQINHLYRCHPMRSSEPFERLSPVREFTHEGLAMTANGAVDLETKTGFKFHVRPANPDDDAALAEFFRHVSKDDLRFRFLSAIQKVSDKQIAEMTHVDHRRTEDFMVYAAGGKDIIANAMLAADKAMETAEVAFTVHSDYKGKGLETALLEYVTKAAKARGLKKLQSIESRENHCTIELERKLGFTARGIDGDPMLVLLEARL